MYYSGHIIMLRQNFIIANTQRIDQLKPKYEGGGFSPQSPPPPGSAPAVSPLINYLYNYVLVLLQFRSCAHIICDYVTSCRKQQLCMTVMVHAISNQIILVLMLIGFAESLINSNTCTRGSLCV